MACTMGPWRTNWWNNLGKEFILGVRPEFSTKITRARVVYCGRNGGGRVGGAQRVEVGGANVKDGVTTSDYRSIGWSCYLLKVYHCLLQR